MRHLLTTPQVAEILGVSASTVRRRVADGSLTPIRFGGLIRFSPAQVEGLCSPAGGRDAQRPGAAGRTGGPMIRTETHSEILEVYAKG